VADQRAVALADVLGDVALQVEANCWLGTVYRAFGNYRRAIECYEQSLAAIPAERRYERFALGGVPAVQCRALLVWSLAEQGGFATSRTDIDEALHSAERVAHTITVLHAYFGTGFLALRQGDLPTAISRLERGLEICQGRQALATVAH
jgi:tetratricopeptide (TPR) repeat protein